MNNARKSLSGSGVQTAAIALAGGPGSSNELKAELYDGTSWTTTSELTQTGKSGNAAGTSSPNSASIVFGGGVGNATTEEFTGSTLVTSASTLTTS